MILGFKTKFPWGTATEFIKKILKYEGYKPKIHTLRGNFRFKPGMVIHFAIGVRTKLYYEFYKDTCKSTQTVVIVNIPNIGIPYIFIDGRRLNHNEELVFAYNDGFNSIEDFARWFNKPIYSLQLINWTDFKY